MHMNRIHYVLFVCLVVLTTVESHPKRTFVWMCLEICGGNETSIAADLQEIAAHNSLLSAVSFERYTLGSNADFVDFSSTYNLTDVTKYIPANLEMFPMLSSWPHIPEFLDHMRLLFKQPGKFILDAVNSAVHKGYAGYDVDFEPTSAAAPDDAVAYAAFLTLFAETLQGANKKLTVDVASWSQVWNLTLINGTRVDTIHTMSTYTSNFTYFMRGFSEATEEISLSKLGIGIDTADTNLSQGDYDARSQILSKANIQEIDIWRLPLNTMAWDFVKRFMTSD